MIIDLDNLTREHRATFNENIDQALAIYNEMSSELLNRSDELAWLVNNVTSRNTVFSNLLLDIRYLIMIESLNKEGQIEKIKTKDRNLAEVLKQKYVVECNEIKIRQKTCTLIKSIKQIGFTLLWSTFAMTCKSKKRVKAIVRSGADIDIDTC